MTLETAAMRVAFLNPANAADPFFGSLCAFMGMAADQLGIELETVEGDRLADRILVQGRELASRTPPPEYLLLVNELQTAIEILPLAVDAGIKVLLFCQGTLSADRTVLGEPRQKHPRWLGELLPDDRASGSRLGEALIEEARRRGLTAANGEIQVCGLSGPYTAAAIARISGLRSAVARSSDASLKEVAPGDWTRDSGLWWTTQLLERNPETTVVWAACDALALGAAEGIVQMGRLPGKDVLVGGIDWAPFAFPKVREGVFTATMGGHFMDGAWALILLYDHHHGRDFRATRIATENVVVTAGNVAAYTRLLDRSQWHRLDFLQFSKHANPSLERYLFSPDTVLSKLR